MRQIQKNESQYKQETKRVTDKFQSQLHSKKRDYDKKIEEMEDKMYQNSDHADSLRRDNERLERETFDLKK